MNRPFYIYVLFDAEATPRYVGKGCGSRINHHLRPDNRNPIKEAFVRKTLKQLGDLPRLKIREHLTEDEAFIVEIALIKALGRICNDSGILTNLTEGGDGYTSESAKQFHRSMTPDEKLAWKESISRGHQRTPFVERSARAKRRTDAVGFERMSALGKARQLARKASGKPFSSNGGLAAGRLIWINDGIGNKRIDPNDAVPPGWKRGRLFADHHEKMLAVFRTNCAGRSWITNGTRSRRIKNGEMLPEGWRYGRIASIAPSNAAHCNSVPSSPIAT